MCFFSRVKSVSKDIESGKYGEIFRVGEYAISNGKYPYENVGQYFTEKRKVVSVRNSNNIKYAGYQFVFFSIDGVTRGFYSNGLKKV